MCRNSNNRLEIHKARTDKTETRNKSTIIVGNFNTLLFLIDRSNKVKTSMDIEDLNSVNHYIQKKPNTYLSIHRTFTKIEHMLGYKMSLITLKRMCHVAR